MKKSLLGLMVIFALLSSSATRCLSDSQQIAIGILGVAILGIGAYACQQSPHQSISSSESHTGSQIQQQKQQKKESERSQSKPKLKDDAEKSDENKTFTRIEPMDPIQENIHENSFLAEIWERLGEEKASEYFDIIIN